MEVQMDFKFLWYANATVIDSILPRYKQFDDVFDIVLLQKTIRDKYITYDVTIGGEHYHYIYTFFSNVCIAGSLEIVDASHGKTYTYALERNNDSIRLYTNLEDYNEMYMGTGSNSLTDIQVQSCRKVFTSWITITKEEEVFKVAKVPFYITDEYKSNFDYTLFNQLFTVTGAIDYPSMVCYDVVNVRNRSSQIVLYAEAKCQMIVTHTFKPDHNMGIVHPVNADFTEYIEYEKLKDYHYRVVEYIKTSGQAEQVKRRYELINEGNIIIRIDHTNKLFNIHVDNNDVVFTRA